MPDRSAQILRAVGSAVLLKRRDVLDLDLPGRIREAADDERARRLAIAKHLAARLAGSGDISRFGRMVVTLTRLSERLMYPGDPDLRLQILPGKAALLDDIVRNCAVHPLPDLPAYVQRAGDA